ncbi:hypothetical protein WME79_41995 [Sorangium sp. So ce726]|uniref:hypothetical protein n=1 Tax=Sorangium sp. So ce726 TaxID=3133319 RepID=UPI003F5E4EF0
MSKSRKDSLFVVALVAVAGAVSGCGGYDTEKAREVCAEHVGEVTSPALEASYADCMDCYQECGSDCAVMESFPPQFACSD